MNLTQEEMKMLPTEILRTELQRCRDLVKDALIKHKNARKEDLKHYHLSMAHLVMLTGQGYEDELVRRHREGNK